MPPLPFDPGQRRENAKVKVVDAGGKGMGLRLLEPVAKRQFIAEYVGEVRKHGTGLSSFRVSVWEKSLCRAPVDEATL